MNCPFCGAISQSLRRQVGPEAVKRRRQCTRCDRRFNTYEVYERPMDPELVFEVRAFVAKVQELEMDNE
jgi:transcriptional regulator NrdR family protein